MNRNFTDFSKSTFCSHLQIIKTVCGIKYLILDLRIFSVHGHRARSLLVAAKPAVVLISCILFYGLASARDKRTSYQS